MRTPDQGSCWYLDVHLEGPGSRVFQEIPTGFNAFIYTLGPAPIRVGDGHLLESHQPFHTLVLTNKANITDASVDPSTVPQENGVWIEHVGTEAGQEARLVVIAGQPLDQKVYQYG